MMILALVAGGSVGRADQVGPEVGSNSGPVGTEAFRHRWASGVPFSSPEATIISIAIYADHLADGSTEYRMDRSREDCDQDSCVETEQPAAHAEAIRWDFDLDAGRIDADVVGLWLDGSTCRMTFGFQTGELQGGSAIPVATYVRPDLVGPTVGVAAAVGRRSPRGSAASEPDTLSVCDALHPGDLPWESGFAFSDTGHHDEVYVRVHLP